MMVVEARVAGAGQLEDARADRLRETAWRWPAPVAMGQGLESRAADAGEEPAHMAQRNAQKLGSLPGAEGAGFDPGEDLHTLLLSMGQRDRLLGHSPKVTDSLAR